MEIGIGRVSNKIKSKDLNERDKGGGSSLNKFSLLKSIYFINFFQGLIV